MSSPSPGKRRMDTDIIKLVESKHEVTILDSMNEFIVRFDGPSDTPYEGGSWNVRVDLPESYPFKSPSIGFMNRIFHPNIDEVSGTVCLNVINQTWTALYDLRNIFESFLPQLLSYPNPTDPLNGDAASLLLHKPEDYRKRVTDYVRKYATEAAIQDQLRQATGGEQPISRRANRASNSNGASSSGAAANGSGTNGHSGSNTSSSSRNNGAGDGIDGRPGPSGQNASGAAVSSNGSGNYDDDDVSSMSDYDAADIDDVEDPAGADGMDMN